MIYEGKETCQGCGKPGTTNYRYSKNQLCPNCQMIFDKGRMIDFNDNDKYVNLRQHYHAFRTQWINTELYNILKSLHTPAANALGWPAIKSAFGNNEYTFKIKEKYIEPIKQLFLKIENEIVTVKDEKESIPELIKQQLKVERDKIYNEGIAKGRDLLFQLNLGDISATELNNNYSYNEKNK